MNDAIKQVPDVSAVTLIGGQRRELRVSLNESRLTAHNLSALSVVNALDLANRMNIRRTGLKR